MREASSVRIAGRATFRTGELFRSGGQAFRVVKCLGIGAMGEVYEVEDQNLGIPRVIKLLAPHLAHSAPHLVARFLRESKVLAKIRHPSCVLVLGAGRLDDGNPYYLMERIEGVALSRFIAKKAPFEPEVALPIVAQLASALEEVHARGVVHRDVKPDNVLVSKGADSVRATLLDFGVMRLLSDPVREGYCGTPQYSAPEQLSGEEATPKMDVFALGLVAFEMLTRTRAYEDFASPLERIKVPAPRLTDTAARTSDELVMLLADMLALDPAKRLTARQVQDRLEKCPEVRRDRPRPANPHGITQEELLSIPPLYQAPIAVEDLESHTMPGGPPVEVLEAARRALRPTFRGQALVGAEARGFSDDVVALAANGLVNPDRSGRVADEPFDIMAHAQAVARRAVLRAAATGTGGAPPRGTEPYDEPPPGASELLLGMAQKWASGASAAARPEGRRPSERPVRESGVREPSARDKHASDRLGHALTEPSMQGARVSDRPRGPGATVPLRPALQDVTPAAAPLTTRSAGSGDARGGTGTVPMRPAVAQAQSAAEPEPLAHPHEPRTFESPVISPSRRTPQPSNELSDAVAAAREAHRAQEARARLRKHALWIVPLFFGVLVIAYLVARHTGLGLGGPS